MRSMTGLGLGSAPLNRGLLLVELRAVNHRFQEVRVRAGSAELSVAGSLLEQLCRQRLGRGRYDVSVRCEGSGTAAELDMDRAKAAFQALKALRDALAPEQDVPLSLLSLLPDLLTPRSIGTEAQIRDATSQAFDTAVVGLQGMQEEEGDALERDLRRRLERVRQLRCQIAERGPQLISTYRARLRERLDKLLLDSKVDGHRLEQEVALLADKADVEEELTRLESHFGQLERLLTEGSSIGRRLDFLLQEVAREGNTIGSKCQDADVAHLVIELKAETERMREQVQNVD